MAVHSQSKVAAIQFGIMSPDEIRRRSVAQITSIGLYEGDSSVAGGLFDPRMGVLDYGKLCPTDGLNSHDCPGYFGHIELATPVFHVQFMKQIIGTMKCVCRNCARVMVDPADPNVAKIHSRKKGIARFSAMQEMCDKVKICPHCETTHFASISHNGSSRKDKEQATFGTVVVNIKVERELTSEIWTAQDVLNVLQRISDSDCRAIGFDPQQCRPDWLICQVLPVCPPATRPSVNSDSKSRMEDDLTHKYCDIIKTNRALKAKLEKEVIGQNQGEVIKNSKVVNDWYQLLQYHVATLVNNKISGVPPAQQRSGRPLKSIQERIKYKDGRIRGNLMGKRVDYSARSVITPDPNIGIFELGVPQHVAKRITVPVRVNPLNRARLTEIVRAGYNSYPGAKTIKKKSGRVIALRVLDTSQLSLEVGDVVNRYLMDNDYVLFNRQPSLHKMSMQIHRVIVLPYKTFRLNVQVTTPYNADFDGDEMNMHVPQSKQSQVEVVELAAVPKQILSPGTNAPVIGIVQDTLIGSYLFTHHSNYLSEKDVEDLAAMIPQLTARLPKPVLEAGVSEDELPEDFPRLYWNSKLRYWKGSQIFSIIIPIITMTKATNTSKLTGRSEDKMRIVDGVLKTGIMDKSILGTKENGLVHVIVNDLGTSSAQLFLDDCQRLITSFMLKSGFSVGISDLIADDATLVKMKSTIDDKKSQVIHLMNQVHQGVFENNSGQSNRDEFELQVMSLLNKALSEAGKTGMSTLDSDNRMLRLVQSGSKGSNINIGQMVACVGQQAVDGKRIPYGFTDRTLPHFHKFDDGPTARGFVENSFLHGLRPEEFFFHAMGGREGLIDTAVKTAQTGYIQRRMVKGLEDIRVAQDTTVRDANQRIVQFQYGLDGLDGTYLERQVIPVFSMNLAEMVEHYTLASKVGRVGMSTATSRRLTKQMRETTKMLDDYMAYFLEEKDYAVENLYNRTLEDSVYFCVNIPRVLSRLNVKVTATSSELTPMEIYNIVQPRLNAWKAHFKMPRIHQLLLAAYLHPLHLIRNFRITKEYVEEVLAMMEDTMQRKRIAPGELVGTIAAQSIGEPSTQMTLNSFTYETPIVIRDEKTKLVETWKLGEFVEMCEEESTKNEYYRDTDTTWSPLSGDIHYSIMSVDESGNVEWKRVEAGTRHPVVNEDGSDTMVRVVTSDCQEVVATKAKSFLRLTNGRILPIRGDEIRVGDYIPVSRRGISHKPVHTLSLVSLLEPSAYLYGSEVEKARAVWDKTHWWSKYHGTVFTTPYTRSDSLRSRILQQRTDRAYPVAIESGYVYPKKTGQASCKIPEDIPLDFTFGYLIGAYCAEGCSTKTQISIANNEPAYLEPIYQWCKEHGITTKYYTHHDKNSPGWKSSDIRIYSVVLRDLLVRICGTKSYSKHIHSSIVFSNDECRRGFLTAYIGGDGSVYHGRDHVISATSTSKQLMEDLVLMLRTMDIFSYIKQPSKITSNNRNTKKEDIHQHWCFQVRNQSAVALATLLCDVMTIPTKAVKLQSLSKYVPRTTYRKEQEWIYNADSKGYLRKESRAGRYEDLEFVRIETIEEVPNTTPYAYDLTIQDTKNFAIANQMLVRDTFHYAGVSSKSNVTRGIPRFEEILHLSKNIKSPYMQIELLPEYAFDKEKAMKVLNELSITRLRDVVDETAIYYDPKSTHRYVTSITQHKEMVELYGELMEMTGSDDIAVKNPWVLHMSVNRAKMYATRVSMQDIRYAIDNAINNGEDILECLVADDNADDLVIRIQVKDETAGNGKSSTSEDGDEEEDDTCRDMVDNLKTLEKTILENVMIRGIPGIKGASMSKEETMVKKDGDYEKMNRWVIDTDGVNLYDVLVHPAVDTARTYCNQIHAMADIYGIEAARAIILNEIKEVFEFNDAYVNLRHIMLLVDVMTYRGILMSVDRHGINKTENGPLAKCSFEESTDVIAKSAIFGGMDPMLGVSANIMMGQEVPIGTGAVELVFDEENFRRWKQERRDELEEALTKRKDEAVDTLDTMIVPSECTISSLMEDY